MKSVASYDTFETLGMLSEHRADFIKEKREKWKGQNWDISPWYKGGLNIATSLPWYKFNSKEGLITRDVSLPDMRKCFIR